MIYWFTKTNRQSKRIKTIQLDQLKDIDLLSLSTGDDVLDLSTRKILSL